MRKITLFRHIATAITPFISFHLHKCHITKVYHKMDIAPMQKILKIVAYIEKNAILFGAWIFRWC